MLALTHAADVLIVIIVYFSFLILPVTVSFPLRWHWILLFWLCYSTAAMAQEVCDNGIDDDGNGLVDLNDTACFCQLNDLPHLFNSGFERYHSLPTAISQMQRAQNWHQATYGTSDYFNSLPGGFSPPNLPSPFPSGTGVAGFTVSPGGMENIGACLLYPLLPGIPYTFNFYMLGGRYGGTAANPPLPAYDPINIQLYGSGLCPNFPTPGTDDCPFSHGYTLLGSVYYTSDFNWQQFTINFTPIDTIYSIVIGAQCIPPLNFQGTTQGHPYFWVDDLQITLAAPFVQVRINQEGNACLPGWKLEAVATHQPTAYQWYFEGIALVGQTNRTLDLSALATDSGTYQLRATYPSGCILDSVWVTSNAIDSVYINVIPSRCGLPNGSFWVDSIFGGTGPFLFSINGLPASSQQTYWNLNAGTYSVLVEDAKGCTRLQIFELQNLGPPIQDVFLEINPASCFDSLGSVLIQGVAAGSPPFLFGLNPIVLVGDTMLAQLEVGKYTIYLRDSMGCTFEKEVEIQDSCNLIQCKILAPNTFTPNGDGVNELFKLTSDCEFEQAQWLVYNRWGELVFESRNWQDGWDGTFKGQVCDPGGYAYYFMGRAENRTLVLKGVISLVR